jgi:uncharacterized cupin superfamily protein
MRPRCNHRSTVPSVNASSFNAFGDDGPLESNASGYQWRRARVAGDNLGASVYVLPPGQRTFPLHYELGNDELIYVIEGAPTLRNLDGERTLQAGDTILLPSGPEGAHEIINRSEADARLLIVSNLALPRAAVQVDSNKLMIRWGAGADESLWFRRDDAAGYWDGIPPVA